MLIGIICLAVYGVFFSAFSTLILWKHCKLRNYLKTKGIKYGASIHFCAKSAILILYFADEHIYFQADENLAKVSNGQTHQRRV